MEKKRVLIVTQYFYPEDFRITDFAVYLSEQGFFVDVLTSIPNYPKGHFFQGYGIFAKRKEQYKGINIIRAFQFPRGGARPSFIRLSINYLSYAFCASILAFVFALFRKKYDSIMVFQTSPVTQAIPAVIYSKLKKTPVYTWVQDVWPDSVISTIGPDKKHKFIENSLFAVTEWIYKNSKRIMVSSEGMIPLVNRKNDYYYKTLYVPNWCDDFLVSPLTQVSEVKKGFTIMMAGNLADGIGVNEVIELVEALRDTENVSFVFVGGGAEENFLRESFEKRGLKNVVMTGRRPFAEMPSFYAQADAMLLSLKPTKLKHLQATVPSRFQSYLAAGKPVLAMIDGDTYNIIHKYDCGYAVPSGQYKKLADYIKNVVLRNTVEFSKKGNNGRQLYLDKFTPKKVCKQLTDIIL